ncbi:hypothetical protein D9V29_03540 [Mycetocola manganoxydans]|uniref:Uncharacterized protein n=1 Tax=Mycetocola manganoxydans TaxID=699879 RepID=A0A3L6ZZD1_9MICO|nr:hypothetical protein [Mycetocola manganoxydans]RLP73088.1 hypothetical protein D9V29_03540 [Mycetocola manganoxydans]GHD44147.1 hypothetical protein GCM10008097_11840 [Mycetocola manganoxydans]
MTNNTNNDDYVEPVLPADEHGAREPVVRPTGGDDHNNADYTTTGDPIDSAQHLAEEDRQHATTGVPLSGADDVEGDVDYTTPGNPITAPQHEAEEEIPHATPGNNSAIPQD